jgi:hypothetical protein
MKMLTAEQANHDRQRVETTAAHLTLIILRVNDPKLRDELATAAQDIHEAWTARYDGLVEHLKELQEAVAAELHRKPE